MLFNLGYNGGKSRETKGRYFRDNSRLGAIGVKEGHEYDCSFYVKNVAYKGSLEVVVEHNGEKLTSQASYNPQKSDWTQVKLKVKALKTGIGRFVIKFNGNGEICLDGFYFGDTDSVGVGDPKWSVGKLRTDLVEALKELNPKFIRFPGGCIVEGYDLNNSYYWKNSVGDLFDRKSQINLWGDGQADGGYMQSYEIGFYEYFLLCERLNAQPLPIINAGLACQGRIVSHYTIGDNEFQRYIDDAIDLIEFANGDPNTNKWAKLRADSGHPKPFNLKMMGIGNENFGEIYLKNFGAIKAAVKEKYPEMEIVFSAGFDCYKHKNYAKRREGFNGVHDDCIVDDHFYREPKWCIENADLYDDYDQKARIFLGEYAANTPWDEIALSNNYYSALAEAVFLTNIERNADKVVMASYAPLFSRVGGEQWKHNLINFNSLHTLRTANFYVQKMYAENIGNYYISASNEVDGIYQSATVDKDFLYIKLANIKEEAVSLKINTGNKKINGKGKMQTIGNKDNYARNTLDFYGEPNEIIVPINSEIGFIEGETEINISERSFNVIKIALN
jgi:alpha-L-arabinofuranosidase